MATIQKEFIIRGAPDAVWDVFTDLGAVHTRLAPGFVTDTKLADGVRQVTFANGMVAREALVTVDHGARRLVYSVIGAEKLTHHNASFQVFADGAGSRVVWVADVLPDEAGPVLDGLMEAGKAAMSRALAAI